METTKLARQTKTVRIYEDRAVPGVWRVVYGNQIFGSCTSEEKAIAYAVEYFGYRPVAK